MAAAFLSVLALVGGGNNGEGETDGVQTGLVEDQQPWIYLPSHLTLANLLLVPLHFKPANTAPC
jgi:hypothetical protein